LLLFTVRPCGTDAELERFSPEFRERHIETNGVGDLVAVDTFMVGHLKGVGRVYLQSVIVGGRVKPATHGRVITGHIERL
jgi:hypothetical protein